VTFASISDDRPLAVSDSGGRISGILHRETLSDTSTVTGSGVDATGDAEANVEIVLNGSSPLEIRASEKAWRRRRPTRIPADRRSGRVRVA
jgi:hypothetical protein